MSNRHHSTVQSLLGRTLLGALGSPHTLELLRNPDGTLWRDDRTKGLMRVRAALSDERATALIRHVAGVHELTITREAPVLETEFPIDGSRFTAVVAPVAAGPAFSIRRRASAIFPLASYVEENIVGPDEAAYLRAAVAPMVAGRVPVDLLADGSDSTVRAFSSRPDVDGRPLNIVISGGPGSGKTTLANALIREISADPGAIERIVLIEDTFELQCDAPCHLKLHTTDEVDLRRLVRLTMRLRPDRIVIGEVRGAEALELLKAWNTGAPGGIATVHANSAGEALDRLDQLVREATGGSNRALVAASVDVVAHIERRQDGRLLTAIVQVLGLDEAGDFLVRTHTPTPLKEGLAHVV